MSKTQDGMQRSGMLTAYLIDPAWKGSFPYSWPRGKWPIIQPVFRKENLITTVGQLYSYQHGLKFAYFAGGTGTNNPTPSDRVLQFEMQRFEITDLVYAPGQVDAFTEIAPDTGNRTWEEWGVFMQDGTIQLNTGTLYNHVLQNYTKELGNSILLNYSLREVIS